MKKSFRDLVAFQRATELMLEVYSLTRAFPREELYGLTSQMRRASIGVMAQLAEGHGRATYGEWRQFVSQARGSLFEIEAESIAAEKLEFIQPNEMQHLLRTINGTGRAITGLLNWIRSKETAKPRNRATAKPTVPP